MSSKEAKLFICTCIGFILLNLQLKREKLFKLNMASAIKFKLYKLSSDILFQLYRFYNYVGEGGGETFFGTLGSGVFKLWISGLTLPGSWNSFFEFQDVRI